MHQRRLYTSKVTLACYFQVNTLRIDYPSEYVRFSIPILSEVSAMRNCVSVAKEDLKEILRVSLDCGERVSYLDTAKEEEQVAIVGDSTLQALDQLNVPVNVIDRDQIKKRLSEKGQKYFENFGAGL